ncbi:MAG TPA: hypothetical protein VNW92_26925, partial [Polyangiaceae bacterium]|nr:hypothetical protein [Polyangiaceae bacterium]
MITDNELETLGMKLLVTLHLSVAERQMLSSSGIPASALIAAVSSRLDELGWFPDASVDESELWTGARLERRGQALWVHERYENGVASVGPVRSRLAKSMAEAVRMYVATLGGSDIDGATIDWSA